MVASSLVMGVDGSYRIWGRLEEGFDCSASWMEDRLTGGAMPSQWDTLRRAVMDLTGAVAVLVAGADADGTVTGIGAGAGFVLVLVLVGVMTLEGAVKAESNATGLRTDKLNLVPVPVQSFLALGAEWDSMLRSGSLVALEFAPVVVALLAFVSRRVCRICRRRFLATAGLAHELESLLLLLILVLFFDIVPAAVLQDEASINGIGMDCEDSGGFTTAATMMV